MAPRNGTTSTAPCNGTLLPRPIRQSGSSPSPPIGSKNPYSYRYLGNYTASPPLQRRYLADSTNIVNSRILVTLYMCTYGCIHVLGPFPELGACWLGRGQLWWISLPVNNGHPVDSCDAPAVESLQEENVRQAKTKVYSCKLGVENFANLACWFLKVLATAE